MSTSTIFKYANDISVGRNASSARSITTGGYARTERLGPSFISLDVDLPMLSEEKYLEVENELLRIEDGIQFLTANISSNNGNNIMSGATIPLKPGETSIRFISTDYTTLKQIVLCNLAPNVEKIFKVGDFIQFSTHDKVYQISKPNNESGAYFNSSNAGMVAVKLSTPLVSGVGIQNSSSSGSRSRIQAVNGTSDLIEQVIYDYNYTTTGTAQHGLITFKNTNGTTYQYEDGTYARHFIHSSYSSHSNFRNLLNSCIAGSFTLGDTEQDRVNNLMSEVLDVVAYGGTSNGSTMIFDFVKPNIRVEYTTPLRAGGTFTLDNENITSTITNPAVDGKIKFKLPNGNYVKFRDGTDAEIIIPKANQTVAEIYTYLNGNDVTGSASTHRIKTENILVDVTTHLTPELWGETNLNHHGMIEMKWGPEWEGLEVEFTPTGSIATAYNEITATKDYPASLGTNEITIEDANVTYSVGEYIQPFNQLFSSANYIKRIDGVSVSEGLTTLTTCGNAEGAHIAMNNFSAADASRTAGTYTGVAGTSSGSGTVGTFDITVDSNGAVTNVTIATTGSGHTAGDTITINDSNLGSGGAANFTMDIQTIDTHTGSGFANNSGWNTSTVNDTYSIIKHKDSANQTSTGFMKNYGMSYASTLYKNSYDVYIGKDVNMKLMMTEKPMVTVIPLNETENLYKYGKFKFQEVL